MLLAFLVAAIVQGILEWLPVSSEAFLLLVLMLFGVPPTQALIITIAFHLPTALASIFYYYKEYLQTVEDIIKLQNTYRFKLIIVSTVLSAVTAIPIYYALKAILSTIEYQIQIASTLVIGLIGLLMTATGIITSKSRKSIHNRRRKLSELNTRDSIIIGVIQGFSILPGVTRSGVTLAGFISRRFDRTDSLKGTFIMAGPISLGAFLFLLVAGDIVFFNMFLHELILSLLVCFLVSLITIQFLVRLAEKLNYPAFLKLFGTIMIALSLIGCYIITHYQY